jgi:cell division protein FtsQ
VASERQLGRALRANPSARSRALVGAASQFFPSRRSLTAGLALLTVGVVAYGVARETSIFAVRNVEVSGAPPAVARQVEQVVGSFRGTSLVTLDGTELRARVDALPRVVSVTYDRAFPHTLRVHVRPERPVAVARQGRRAWLVSARGRVLGGVAAAGAGALPRIWLPRVVDVETGNTLPGRPAGDAVAAAALLQTHSFRRVRAIGYVRGGLVFALRDGLQIRLGSTRNLVLKLAVARQIVPALAGEEYLDVSVPERPVSGQKPQVSGGA